MNTTATRTVGTLTEQTGVTVVADWADDIDIPILSGLQRQGDVLIVPTSGMDLFEGPWATTPVPQGGTPVVVGESGGNTHAIYADGDVRVDVRAPEPGRLLAATIAVGPGAVAWLAHPEHGFLGIAPGTYEVRRQREMADELRLVAD